MYTVCVLSKYPRYVDYVLTYIVVYAKISIKMRLYMVQQSDLVSYDIFSESICHSI